MSAVMCAAARPILQIRQPCCRAEAGAEHTQKKGVGGGGSTGGVGLEVNP